MRTESGEHTRGRADKEVGSIEDKANGMILGGGEHIYIYIYIYHIYVCVRVHIYV